MTLTVPSPRAGLAAVILALLLLPAPASARQSATFAVDPQGATSARGYYVFDAAGGAVLEGKVRIANIGDRAGVARLDAVDAATGGTTGAVYRSREEQRWDVGAWTALERPTVRLRPQRSAIVHFTVRVPAGAGAGDHLGGIVVEDAAKHDGGEIRRGRGRFTIDVRSQTIVAVQVRVKGPRRPSLALTALTPGGANGRQTLLLGVRNDGNVLVKGRGRLMVTDAEGNRVQDARFPVDTFVAHTGVQLPVAVEDRVLPAGRYRAVAELRYAGRTTRREFRFAISDHQLGQIYRSRPDLIAPARPMLPYALGGAALALAGFTLAAALFRRPRRRSERRHAEGRSAA
jgi:hypothetical protein